ncbi:MAG TPA: efflux RND transporter periplasmic adaptor subunit [Bryobacteraceae bacterium]|nr:efflux RND transporter periplasmic adaptor subunit [Bryobacteraceae bacterium]
MRKRLFPLIVVVLLGVLTACGEKPRRSEAASSATPVAVQTVTVKSTEWPQTYEAVGTVRARTSTVISAKVMGYVREVRFQTGDAVRQGQLLVALDSRDLDAHYRQAEAAVGEAESAMPEVESAMAAAKANLDLAQVTFHRMKELFDKKSISNQEYDESSARLKEAQANYAMATAKREQLTSKIAQAQEGFQSAGVMRGYSQIVAPFDGVVVEKQVELGNLAAPGAPLATIERAGALRLEASVSESWIALIRAGHKATVTLDALDKTVESRVSEIVPSVDPAARAYTVKIELPPMSQVRSGMFGRAAFQLGSKQTLVAPAGAVIERGQLQSVMVADEGVARTRLVTMGQSLQDQRQVLSGLNPGEKVIYPVPAGLVDGARVEVRP